MLKCKPNGKKLSGASIILKCSENAEKFGDGSTEKTYTVGKNGKIKVYPKENTGEFKLLIKEDSCPTGYTGFSGWLTITIKYDTSTYKVTEIRSSTRNTSNTVVNSDGKYIPISNTDDKWIRIYNYKTTIDNLTILKTDMDGNPMKGVEFTVYFNNLKSFRYSGTTYNISDLTIGSLTEIGDGISVKRVDVNGDNNRIYIYGLTTNSEGKIVFPKLEVGSINTTVYISIEETSTKSGYEILPTNIRLTLKYNSTTNEWQLSERTNETNNDLNNKLADKYWTLNSDNSVLIQLKNESIPKIRIGGSVNGTNYGFNKVGETTGTTVAVPNAKFSATFTQSTADWSRTVNATSNSNGWVSFDAVQPATLNEDVKVTITETEAPTGWLNSNYSKTITYRYNSTAKTWYAVNDSTVTTYLYGGTTYSSIDDWKNSGKIEELKILKKDVLSGNNVDGATFSLKFTNVKKVGNSNANTKGEVTLSKTISGGEIVISDIIIKDSSKNITVEITETSAPANYKKIDGTITLTLTRNGSTLSGTLSKDNTVLDTEVSTNSLTVNGSANTVTIDIKNHEVINLSGQVWLDTQKGEKEPVNPDGKNDVNDQNSDDKGIQGVKAHLYSVKEKKIIATVTTDSNGKYAFNNVIKTNKGFQIYFEYNGILYNDVGIKGDSKAAEIDSERTAFNNRFKTIDVNGADGTSLTYNYSNKESKLNASVDGSTPTNSSIKAYTGVYAGDEDEDEEETKNIDCGLTSKYYDLRLDNLVEKITYTINGKDWEETPNKDSESGSTITYSTSMYYSDYYYRFGDYGVNNIGFRIDDDDTTERDKLKNVGKELEAEVTYKLVVSNQSIHDTKNVKIEYNYDASKYTFVDDPDNKGTITIDTGEFTTAKEILLTFKLNKSAGYLITGDVNTTAEIISYTTNEGALIDADSQPGNGKEEDDISYAKLTFEIANEDREISGNVAEANNSEGKLDGEKIDDVIVQLIEIIEVKKAGQPEFYEYIWQETVSGSNQVKYRTKDNEVDTYTNSLAGNDSSKGQYEFLGYSDYASDSTGNKLEEHTGFIPGDYIVRFIYGDGTTYDLNSNVEKYNGQDYKSTIDKCYTSECYTAGNYSENSSTARDNEARRLEVMAFSTEIDGGLGVALNTLNKDFSQFTEKEKTLLKGYYEDLYKAGDIYLKDAYRVFRNSPGDLPAVNEISDNDIYNVIKYYVSYKTWMSAETSKIEVKDKIDATKVNFGLMLRPETKLTIEKHITGLKITPTGTGVQPIVDATKGIDEEKAKGVTNGLAIIESTRTDRGFWKVETDIEELMQGAKLEVEYTYVIKNNSDGDYLSKILVNAYEGKQTDDEGNPGTELGMTYKEYLEKLYRDYNTKGKTDSYGTYLGSYYYTGNDNATDIAKVKSTVESLEEALNNQLAFTSSSDFIAETLNETDNYDYYNETGVKEKITIKTLVKTNSDSGALDIGGINSSKKIRLETTLASSNNGEIGTTIPSYITEITSYSNAAGRENIAVPENLTYVHSEDNELTLDSYVAKDTAEKITAIKTTAESGYVQINEADEFWGETIIISKPTGANKNTAMLITIIAISSVAVIGVGIILIKKFVIKK